MPRKRMIDPGIWTDEKFLELSVIERFFYIGLISLADDLGRFKANPRALKAKIFAVDEVSVEEVKQMLLRLADVGLIVLYGPELEYGYHPNWKRYQKVPRPSPSKIPSPEEITVASNGHERGLGENSMNIQEQFNECSMNTHEQFNEEAMNSQEQFNEHSLSVHCIKRKEKKEKENKNPPLTPPLKGGGGVEQFSSKQVLDNLVSFWLDIYKRVHGKEYLFRPKDRRVLAELLRLVNGSEYAVKELMRRFVTKRIKFYERSGWGLHLLLSDVNGIVGSGGLPMDPEAKKRVSELIAGIVEKKREGVWS